MRESFVKSIYSSIIMENSNIFNVIITTSSRKVEVTEFKKSNLEFI